MKSRFRRLLALISVFLLATPALAQGVCPPGFYWSRETVACEQEQCPPGAGRTYTLECQCPEGLVGQYETRTDPATGNSYSIMTACVQPGGGGILGWWNRQSTTVRVAVVAGAAVVLVGGAIAAGLITWAGVTALAGAAAATLSSVTPFAAEFVTAWATRKAMKTFAQRLALQTGKYLAKKLGRRATAAELKELMLQLLNQELAKRGLAAWTMPQLETLLWGINLIW